MKLHNIDIGMHAQKNQQSGFTLVELMIALIIGLVLTTGVLQVYLSNKQAFRTNEALARIQEDSRLMTDVLGRKIRMAGYRALPEKKRTGIFPDTSVYLGGSTDGQIVTGTSSSIAIAYQADANILACTADGVTVNAGDLIKTVLSLQSGVLECRSAVCAPCSSGDPTLTSVAARDLVEDITSLTFTYGIDTDSDGAANRYASTVQPTDSVTSVRVSYTLQSSEQNTGVYDTTTNTRKKLSKTYSTTIALRNIVP